MTTEPYIEKLVADSAAFLRNVPLHHMAREVVTCPSVVAEIRDTATRDRLQVLPYELCMREPSDEAVRQVSEFARQTGDLRFLSATDVRVLALTLQVTRETVGEAHLRLRPPPAPERRQVDVYHPKHQPRSQLPVGFVAGKVADLTLTASEEPDAVPKAVRDEMGAEGSEAPHCAEVSEQDTSLSESPAPAVDKTAGSPLVPVSGAGDHSAESKESDADDPAGDEMFDAQETLEDDVSSSAEEDTEEGHESGDDEDADAADDDDSDDGGGGWITPANIQTAKAEMNLKAGEVKEPVKVACMTTDFTMQNVLKLMNLDMVSVEGRRIREARRFVLRCFGCYQITPDTEKEFCPWCGHKTLKRVSVTLRPDGTQQVHISARKPISKRGTKFSLPLPRGGKYSVAPILCGDQPLPQQRATARSQAKNAILSEDFVAGASPFSAHDVNSRAAQMGRSGQRRHVPNWERRNPNARAPPTGNKKRRK